MSAASLLSVYDGANPAVLVVAGAGGAGATPTLAAVLQVGNSAGVDDIDMNAKSLLDLLDLTGTAGNRLDITSGVGQGVKVEGLVGASLVATTGGAAITTSAAAADITLTSGGDVELSFLTGTLVLQPLAADFTPVTIAAGKPTWVAAQQLKIKIGATDYWIPMSSAVFA